MPQSVHNNSFLPPPWPEHRIKMWGIGGPIVFVMGVVGNVMTLVLVHKFRDKSPSHQYMMALSVTELIVGFVETRMITFAHSGVGLDNMSLFTCKTGDWLLYSCRMASSWFVAGIVMCRAAEVARRRLTTSYNAKIIQVKNVALCVIIFAFNSFSINMKTLVWKNGRWECTFVEGFGYKLYIDWWHNLGEFILPLIPVTMGNVVLIRKLVESPRHVPALGHQSHPHHLHPIDKHLTVLPFVMSVAFVVFIFPELLIQGLIENARVEDQHAYADAKHTICFLFYLNSASHFYLYVSVCRDFRHRCVETVRKCKCPTAVRRSSMVTLPLSSHPEPRFAASISGASRQTKASVSALRVGDVVGGNDKVNGVPNKIHGALEEATKESATKLQVDATAVSTGDDLPPSAHSIRT